MPGEMPSRQLLAAPRASLVKRGALAVLAILLAAGVARGQDFGAPLDRSFRLELDPPRVSRGRPVITGYIYNDYGMWAENVTLLVEGLDASGQVVARTTGYVNGSVPGGGRTSFEVPVPSAAVTYRVKVRYYDLRGGGS